MVYNPFASQEWLYFLRQSVPYIAEEFFPSENFTQWEKQIACLPSGDMHAKYDTSFLYYALET